jgi:hypothetical protein
VDSDNKLHFGRGTDEQARAKGENVMKSSWDAHLEQQLKKPKARKAFEEEKRVLNIGISLAKERKRKGLTQEAVA